MTEAAATVTAATGTVHQAAAPVAPSMPVDAIHASIAQDIANGKFGPDPAGARMLANESLKRDGIAELPELTTAEQATQAEAQTAAAAEIDKAFPPAQAHELQLPRLGEIAAQAGIQASDQKIHDVAIKIHGWALEMKAPAGVTNFVFDQAAKVDRHWNSLTDAGQANYIAEQKAILGRMFGAELPQKLALAKQLVRELDAKPAGKGFMDFMTETGAGNNAAIIAQIISHAERRLARIKR
jgi:hypothetical protein